MFQRCAQSATCVTANGGDCVAARNMVASLRLVGIAAAVSFFAPILRLLLLIPVE